MTASTREEEVVRVRLGDSGAPATAARRFIERKYGHDQVDILSVTPIKKTGALQSYLVTFDLDLLDPADLEG